MYDLIHPENFKNNLETINIKMIFLNKKNRILLIFNIINDHKKYNI